MIVFPILLVTRLKNISLYRVAQKECNDFDPEFQRHSWLNAIDFYCIFPSNLTPSSSSMDKAFWFYRGVLSEAVSFSKCATPPPPPASRLEAAGICHLTASHCVDKNINALTLKRMTTWMKPSIIALTLKRMTTWMKPSIIALTLKRMTTWMKPSIIALTLKRMTTWMKPRHSYCLPFKVRAIMLLSTQLIQWDAVRWKFPAASSLLAGGKVALMTLPQKNSPTIKTPYPYLMNLVSNYLEKNILSNTVKNQWHLLKNVVEITDQNRCILFGPPWIENDIRIAYCTIYTMSLSSKNYDLT